MTSRWQNRGRNYDDPLYKEFRSAVRKRDKSTCQYPGCGCRKRVHVHHIKRWADYPGLRYLVENGICLCAYHHSLTKGNEEQYERLFYEIIRGRKDEGSEVGDEGNGPKTNKRRKTRSKRKTRRTSKKRTRRDIRLMIKEIKDGTNN